jgi:hypothetical protein
MHRKIAKSYDNLRSITFMQIKYREILHRSQITKRYVCGKVSKYYTVNLRNVLTSNFETLRLRKKFRNITAECCDVKLRNIMFSEKFRNITP